MIEKQHDAAVLKDTGSHFKYNITQSIWAQFPSTRSLLKAGTPSQALETLICIFQAHYLRGVFFNPVPFPHRTTPVWFAHLSVHTSLLKKTIIKGLYL